MKLELLYGFPDVDVVSAEAVYIAAQIVYLSESGVQLKRIDGIRRTGKRGGIKISIERKGYQIHHLYGNGYPDPACLPVHAEIF